MKSLWKNLDTLSAKMKNPIKLIEEQSNYLSEGTEDMFEISIDELGKLGTATLRVLQRQGIEANFKYRAELASDYLPEYSFTIMSIYYDISFYPLVVSLPREISEEFDSREEFKLIEEGEIRKYFEVSSQTEFEFLLETVFNTEKVRTVLQNMKAIIDDETIEE